MEFNLYIKDKSSLTQKEIHMKNALILISLSTISLANSAEAIQCSKKNINKEEAVECAQEFLEKADDLYQMAQNKGHLADISKCTTYTSKDGGSYFTDDKESFVSSMGGASIDKCTLSENQADQYVCYIENGPKGCFIPKNSNGMESTTFAMKIGETSGKLITFYPIKQL